MSELTTAEKVAAIEASGMRIVFDGCHKIYVAETPADIAEAESYGYDPTDIYPASEIRDIIQRSCFLVFVHAMSLRDDFPWDIPQGDEELVEIFWPESVESEHDAGYYPEN